MNVEELCQTFNHFVIDAANFSKEKFPRHCHGRIKQTVEALPLDLHVLGTPPAFILSQDQTLH
jgi:hypothetical protein